MYNKNKRSYDLEYSKKYAKKIKDKYGIGVNTIKRYGLKLALNIYDKFGRKCSQCGEENNLTIHHINGKGWNYEINGLEPDNSIENLQILCRKCHGSLHGKEYYRKQAELRGGYLYNGREKEYRKEWKERHKNYYKEYYEKHKEKIKEYIKEYRKLRRD